MKALQIFQPHYIRQVQIDLPDLKAAGPDRILVQPEWVSMCGSDIPFFTGSKRYISYPLPAGGRIHECTGKVVDSTSEQFRPGDQVVAIPEQDLGLAEYFVTQVAKAAKIPHNLNDHGTSCLIQPLSTVINAVDRLGNIQGKTVAVVGLGSIGLLFCWLMKKRGAAWIAGIDPLEQRCQVAQQMGADQVFAARSIEVWQDARQFPGRWDPPDICIEAVGHQMETINDCLGLVSQGGTVLAFGVPDQFVYAIEYETFFRKNVLLMASVTPDWSTYLAKSRDIFLANRNELEGLFTHRLPIREAGKAFSLYERHVDGILKAIIDMSAW